MDAALLLAALASRAGDRVDLLAYDRAVRARVEGVPATGLLPALVQAMAPLDASLVEPDYRGHGRRRSSPARPRRSLVVLLTALDTAPVEEGLLPVLGQLTRRHGVVLASVADPRVAEMAAGRGDAAAVYDAAAADRAGAGAGAARARCCAAGASRSSTRPRPARPGWPTATSRSRPPAGSDPARSRSDRRPGGLAGAGDAHRSRRPGRRGRRAPRRRRGTPATPAAPMPTRAQVGRPDGVTNASTTPETARVAARPSASAPAAWPSSASACDRVRGPGSIQAQPSRSPAPAATKTQVSSSRPCGRISPKNTSSRPPAAISPPDTPTLSAFGPEDPEDRARPAPRGPARARRPTRCWSRPGRRTTRPAPTSSSPRSRARRAGGSAPARRCSPAPAASRPPTSRRPARPARRPTPTGTHHRALR